jgi:hypothetical protein
MMKSKANPASAAMWDKHRKQKDVQFRQRERQQRLRSAAIIKPDQALIEEALANGRFTKCAPGVMSDEK